VGLLMCVFIITIFFRALRKHILSYNFTMTRGVRLLVRRSTAYCRPDNQRLADVTLSGCLSYSNARRALEMPLLFLILFVWGSDAVPQPTYSKY